MEEKLLKLDKLITDMLNQKEMISEELQVLKNNDQIKSYRYRELMGRKLINNEIVNVLNEYKLIEIKEK